MTARTLTGIVLASVLAGGLAVVSPAYAQQDTTKQEVMPPISSGFVAWRLTPQDHINDFLSKKEYREAAKYFADNIFEFGECERRYFWGQILAGMAETPANLSEEICFTTAAHDNLVRARGCGSWYNSLRSGEKFFLNMGIFNLEVKLRKWCYSEVTPVRSIRPADTEDIVPVPILPLPYTYMELILRNNPPNVTLYPPVKPALQK